MLTDHRIPAQRKTDGRKIQFDIMTIMDLPRKLSEDNIDVVVNSYLNMVSGIPLHIESENFLGLMRKLKRVVLETGPYPNVSIFEAANRIMSDLVILFGVRDLLYGRYPEINTFKEFTVEFGNEKKNAHDIMSENSGAKLIGEAFNVAPSFFHGKSSSAVKKLLNIPGSPEFLIILCNSDCYSFTDQPYVKGNRVRILPVDIKI